MANRMGVSSGICSFMAAVAGALTLAHCSSTPPAGGDAGEDGASSSSGAGSSSGGASSGAGSSGASSSGASSSGSSSGGGALTWYYTCGYPSCPVSSGGDASVVTGLTDDAGAPCPAVGTACTSDGATCGTSTGSFHCGAVETCAASDPTMTKYGCPISSRQHKDGITYVSDDELQTLHDETLRFQLATYNYKPDVADPAARHLGFLIEDTPPASPAVGWSRQRVDLYGYLSMVVATMQVQEKEITELRRELAAERGGSCR